MEKEKKENLEIAFSDEFKQSVEQFRVLCVKADIDNLPTPDSLWNEIEEVSARLAGTLPVEDIKNYGGIKATREAYKALGKEPNRYRPSAEALCRRIVKDKGLYRTLGAIDAVNLISVITGHSIGGFDRDKIQGSLLTLSKGIENEPFEAIGRGQLNIGCLPVYRDAIGPIGTPTSDNIRTSLSPDTRRIFLTINVYQSDADIDEIQSLTHRILSDYLNAGNIRFYLRSY